MKARLSLTASFMVRLLTLAAVLACSAHASPWKAYWSDVADSMIRRINPDGSGAEDVVGSPNVRGIAFDPGTADVQPVMYWTSPSGGGKVFVGNINGGDQQALLSIQGNVSDIALDLDGSMMYWANISGSIQRAGISRTNLPHPVPPNPAAQTIIVGGGSVVYGIALDVVAGKIYWTDYGTGAGDGRIRCAELDGTLLPGEVWPDLEGPVDVEVDTAASMLYWLELDSGKLRSADAGDPAAAPQDVVTGLDEPIGLALDPILGYAYWTEQGSTDAVSRIKLDSPGAVVEVLAMSNQPWAIALCDPPPQLVPTLTEWGIILLASVVAISGAVHVGKMRRAHA